MLTGYEFYKIYHSLKLHFTTDQYDVLKYHGSTGVSFSSYERRVDKLRFDNFAKKLMNKNKAGQLCIANFLRGSFSFIYDQYENAYDVYLQWKKIRESITREFQKDVSYINQLASSRASFDLFAKTASGKNPPILQIALGNKINVETLIILSKEHKDFFDTWAAICHNDPMVMKTLIRWKKYTPFVVYDVNKIKPILEGALF